MIAREDAEKARDRALEWLRTHRDTHSARKLDVKALVAAVDALLTETEPEWEYATAIKEPSEDGAYIRMSQDEATRAFGRFLDSVKAAAWDEGHKHWSRRGPDNCHCSAWSSSECGCGKYGTGELISLKDNPYRKDPE